MPNSPYKVVGEAFRYIREFLEDLRIPFPPSSLNRIEEAMANLEPLGEAENHIWGVLVETVNSMSMRKRAETEDLHHALRELIGPLTPNLPSMLPWYFKGPSVRNVALIATDVRGVPVPAIRPVPVHDLRAQIDMTGPHTHIVGGDNTYTTVEDGGFSWTLLHDPTLDENRLPLSQGVDSAQVFVPVEYWEDKAFAIDSPADTTLLLRSVLEEFGLYRTMAVVTENIHVLNTNGPKETSESSHLGFGVRRLPEDIWVEMFEVSPLVKAGLPPTQGILNAEITPEIAAIALNNLKRIFFALKEMGVAMKSWNHLIVNKYSGEVYLGEGDRPVLVDAILLQTATTNPAKFLDSVYSKDAWPHFPNLVVVGRFPELMRGDSQLFLIIKQLAEKSGTPHSSIDDGTASQILEDFRLLAEFEHDPDLMGSIKDPEKRKMLFFIAEYYLGVLKTNGVLNFWNIVMPAVIERVRPEKWLDASIALITGALRSGEPNKDNYWAKNIGFIQTIGEDGIIRNGEGGGGAQSPPVGGSWGGANDPDDPQIPQAQGPTIGGIIKYYSPPGQLNNMQALIPQQSDIAIRPYNLNLAFWGGLGVLGILPGGANTLLN